MNLLNRFLPDAERWSGRQAIIEGSGRTASFGELLTLSAALAGAWRRRGIGRGDRVLLVMPLGIELYASLLALWRLGAVAVFPEPALGLAGVRNAVEAARPKALLSSGWYRILPYLVTDLRRIPLSLHPDDTGPSADTLEAVDDGHPALISFTSGSTGRPKAIVRSHGMLAVQTAAISGFLAPEEGEMIDLVAFPAFVLAELTFGVTSVLPDWNLRRQHRVAPTALASLIDTHRVTRALLPPMLCERLSRAPTPGLRSVFTGGGPVFPDLLRRLMAALPETSIHAVYGSTEAEPIAHFAADELEPAAWRTIAEGGGLPGGRPVPGLRLRLAANEIQVAGPWVNRGYLDPADDASTKLHEDGKVWHRTGDAGRLDRDGRLWLLGRVDGQVGGLFPFPVEAAARSWKGVTAAALVGRDQRAVLAVAGDAGELGAWRRSAALLGDIEVLPVREIPLDRRHHSKVDYPRLRRMIAKLKGEAPRGYSTRSADE